MECQTHSTFTLPTPTTPLQSTQVKKKKKKEEEENPSSPPPSQLRQKREKEEKRNHYSNPSIGRNPPTREFILINPMIPISHSNSHLAMKK